MMRMVAPSMSEHPVHQIVRSALALTSDVMIVDQVGAVRP
jgi:hypothetical protein